MKLTEMLAAARDDVSRWSAITMAAVSRSPFYQAMVSQANKSYFYLRHILPAHIANTAFYQAAAEQASDGVMYLRQTFPTLDSMFKAVADSQDAQMVLNRAFLANLADYALPVIYYEGYIRPLVVEGMFYQNIVDYPVKLFFCGKFAGMFVANAAYNMSLAKSLTTFVPQSEQDNACKCIATTRLAAAFSNNFHALGNLVSVTVLQQLAKTGNSLITTSLDAVDDVLSSEKKTTLIRNYLTVAMAGVSFTLFSMQALAYGYSLVAIKYANHGICARHQRELVNNNKLFCFLVGASFLTAVKVGSYALNTVARVESNLFLEDAVFSHLYHYFMLFSLLKMGTLKGSKKALEMFYWQRVCMDYLLRSSSNKFVQGLQSDPDPKQQSCVQVVNSYLDTSVTRAIVSTKAISLMLSLHADDIMAVVNGIVAARQYPIDVVNYIPRVFTPQSVQVLTKILQQRGWEDTRVLLEKLVNLALAEGTRHDERDVVVMQQDVGLSGDVAAVGGRLENLVSGLIENYSSAERISAAENAALLVRQEGMRQRRPLPRERNKSWDGRSAEVSLLFRCVEPPASPVVNADDFEVIDERRTSVSDVTGSRMVRSRSFG